MKIKKIISQYRKDFKAIYECEYCGHTEESWGYDDEFFHKEVLPCKVCHKCGRKASGDFVPYPMKYPDRRTL
jgi:hypothetical protein